MEGEEQGMEGEEQGVEQRGGREQGREGGKLQGRYILTLFLHWAVVKDHSAVTEKNTNSVCVAMPGTETTREIVSRLVVAAIPVAHPLSGIVQARNVHERRPSHASVVMEDSE